MGYYITWEECDKIFVSEVDYVNEALIKHNEMSHYPSVRILYIGEDKNLAKKAQNEKIEIKSDFLLIYCLPGTCPLNNSSKSIPKMPDHLNNGDRDSSDYNPSGINEYEMWPLRGSKFNKNTEKQSDEYYIQLNLENLGM